MCNVPVLLASTYIWRTPAGSAVFAKPGTKPKAKESDRHKPMSAKSKSQIVPKVWISELKRVSEWLGKQRLSKVQHRMKKKHTYQTPQNYHPESHQIQHKTDGHNQIAASINKRNT